MAAEKFDIIVLGSGPAGQKAAIQGAKAGKRVLIVESEEAIGGACVHRGTIPSKTLRETAVALNRFKKNSGQVYDVVVQEDLQIASCLVRMEEVVVAHERFIGEQIERNKVSFIRGRGSFVSPHEIQVLQPGGKKNHYEATWIVIATGSRPRSPGNIPIDHEHILDSDSILSMVYLPKSLVVLGAGVIACEYATIFGNLGVKVTIIDKGPRPLGFLDKEMTDGLLKEFHAQGHRFVGDASVKSVAWDGLTSVHTTLESGEVFESEKLLFALGRVANVEGLNLEAATGVKLTARGLIEVDDKLRTGAPHIYAAGDVIGPPSLASSSMEQGRRAVCDALGLKLHSTPEMIPMGIYTIPEISSVGLSEDEAKQRFGGALVGRARFRELARGQIASIQEGMLKMVADAKGEKLLGIQVIGEGATELVAVGQMGLLMGASVDLYVDSIFNFPTLAEAYRVAALDIAKQR